MAVDSIAYAEWKGDLIAGSGKVRPASNAFGELELTWANRSQSRESGTSPEELIAAAHAGCFSMALSNRLSTEGHKPDKLNVTAKASFEAGKGITGIELSVTGSVPGITPEEFQAAAEFAKANCPVSKALAGVSISLTKVSLE